MPRKFWFELDWDGEIRIGRKSWILKSYIFIIIILLLLFGNLNLNIIGHADNEGFFTQRVVINLDQPFFSQIKNNNTSYSIVHLSESIPYGIIGSPQIPSKIVRFLIPYQKSFHDISIESLSTINLSSKIQNTCIYPLQKEFPFSHTDHPHLFAYNRSIYNAQQWNSHKKVQVQSIDWIAGFPVVTALINPFDYHPYQEYLLFSNEIKITIRFQSDEPGMFHPLYRGITPDVHRVSSLISNPESLTSYPITDQQTDNDTGTLDDDGKIMDTSYDGGLCDSTESIDYVIVTSSSLLNDYQQPYTWEDLLFHREQSDGLNGTIVTIEDILSCNEYYNKTDTFNDSAARLREFCKDAYLDWNTQYILLGGDWSETDPQERIVPSRTFTDPDENESGFNTLPCDLYYSNLDGNWYNETNEVWGGGRYAFNDKLSELSVGRIPVYTTEMVSNAVEKILWYDSCDDIDWLQSAAFLGGDLGWPVTSKQYMEELRIGNGSYQEYVGFEEWNMAFPDYELNTQYQYYEEDYGSENDAVLAWLQAINENSFSLINHLDHGSYSNTLSLGYGGSLSNDHFFLGTSQACLSGRFTAGISGAEGFICDDNTSGAFALLLNTGYGYGSSSSTSGSSQLQHKIWWDYFFSNQTTNFYNWRLGSAMQYTKDMFSAVIETNSHAYCYVWYSWNLFGDPAQQLQVTLDDNVAPLLSDPMPSNGSEHVDKNCSELSVSITDADGDMVNWTIETSPDIGSSSGNNDVGGIKTCEISEVEYNSSYTWFVNASDGSHTVQSTYVFTTRQMHYPNPPTNIESQSVNRTSIRLFWVNDNSSDGTRIERHHISSWERGEGTLVYNTSGSSMVDESLLPNSTYYYQMWGWNQTDQIFSERSSFIVQCTLANHQPEIMVNPLNNSIGQPCLLDYTVHLSDLDEDQLSWSITSSHGEHLQATTCNTTITLPLQNLSDNTTYTIWVNLTDSFATVNHWYQFTTHQIQIPPQIIRFSASIKNSTEIHLSWEKPEVNQVLLECHYSQEWGIGQGTKLYNGSAQDSYVHGGLQRNTTYYYQIWQYNTTYQTYSESAIIQMKTPLNIDLILSDETPKNNSLMTSLPDSWSIQIEDEDDDRIDWNISISSGDYECHADDTSGLKTVSLSNITYDQTYTVTLSVTDGFSMINRSYVFQTDKKPAPSQPPSSSGSGGGFMPVETNLPPIANLGENITRFVGENIVLTAIQSTDEDTSSLRYRWDFTSDGVWDTEWLETPQVNTSYQHEGTFKVTVEVSDGTSSDQDWIIVQITPGNHPPEVIRSLVNECLLLDEMWQYELQVYDSDADLCRYKIDYGDEYSTNWSTYQEINDTILLSYTFETAGSFVIRILVEDIHHARSGWINLGNVTVLPPTDSYFVSPPITKDKITIHESKRICFDASTFTDSSEQITMVSWYVDDVLLSNQSQFCYQFSESGSYTISCSYVTNQGRSYQTDQLVLVERKSANSEFDFFFVLVFGVLSVGVAGGSMYALRKKKAMVPARMQQSFSDDQKNSSQNSYEQVSKQVDEIIEKKP